MFQNIVIGHPIVEPWTMFSESEEEFEANKERDTLFTDSKFLPDIMVKAGIVSSKGEVRRNQPKLVKTLEPLDFVEIKWGKKRLFILVGYDTKEEAEKKIKECSEMEN